MDASTFSSRRATRCTRSRCTRGQISIFAFSTASLWKTRKSRSDPMMEAVMLTRREFGTLALAGALVRLKPSVDAAVEAAGVDSTVNGVRLGVQTYSFRDLPRPAGAADSVDVVIKAMLEAGVSDCELFA